MYGINEFLVLLKLWDVIPSMGVGGGTSGTSADVPVCRTYTPVGLKPMRKKKAKNEKKMREKKTGEKAYFEEESE